jgi:phosphopantetheinyl transferase (holo-ACP synthase)
LSTWTCERDGHLLGCGVDAESIARFERPGGTAVEPWSLIFTEGEVAHTSTLDRPAVALCASFTVKEAVTKALGTAIDFRDCELLFSPGRDEQDVRLSTGLRDEHGIAGWTVRVTVDDGECVATALLFGRS